MTVDLVRSVLDDGFARVADGLPRALHGLTGEVVLWQPDPAANSIGWLAWHLTRVQDDHLAGVVQRPQVWTEEGFAQRFELPYPSSAIGYGQSAEDVAAFDVADVDLLLAYHAAVHAMTTSVLADFGSEADYLRIVDERWNPPVTAAVRLVSVINDTTAHLGQIEYLRGLAERRADT